MAWLIIMINSVMSFTGVNIFHINIWSSGVKISTEFINVFCTFFRNENKPSKQSRNPSGLRRRKRLLVSVLNKNVLVMSRLSVMRCVPNELRSRLNVSGARKKLRRLVVKLRRKICWRRLVHNRWTRKNISWLCRHRENALILRECFGAYNH